MTTHTVIKASDDGQAIFRYPSQAQAAAWILILLSFGIASIGSLILQVLGAKDALVVSVRLLAFACMWGPILWLILQSLYRRCYVALSPSHVFLRQPMWLFSRKIPYQEIAVFTVLDNAKIALIWLKPRRVAPGDEARPPSPKLIVGPPIENVQACVVLLQEQWQNIELAAQDRHWQVNDIYRRKQRRAILRRLALFILTPFVCLFMMLLVARTIFALFGIYG